MKVACLFDIHGNLPALEAVLAEPDVAGADLVVCGGDAVPGPFPAETVALLRGLGDRLVAIHGNGERSVVAREEEHACAWAAEQLTEDDLAWLAALPGTAELDGGILVCHGTPRSDTEMVTLVTPDERLGGILAGVQAKLIVAGHSHSQIDRVVDGIRWVNAGSVGMPYERDPGAHWALVAPEVELRRTPYDAVAAAERIRATEYPNAETYAAEYVLSQHPPEETAPFFEALEHAPERQS